MNGDELLQLSQTFNLELDRKKKEWNASFPWYPYGTLNNFVHLREGFNLHPLETLSSTKHVADIGGADGDLAFFLQSLGYRVDIIDNASTNFNGLQGARTLIDILGVSKSVKLVELDIDEQFALPEARYDLIFLLGILYHLKNPYYILEKLSYLSRNLWISTRIMRFGPGGEPLHDIAVAYLLNPDESNNDSTNYWIFTERALTRIVTRAGWKVTYYTTRGDTTTSNPNNMERDERAFMLLSSTRAKC